MHLVPQGLCSTPLAGFPLQTSTVRFPPKGAAFLEKLYRGLVLTVVELMPRLGRLDELLAGALSLETPPSVNSSRGE